MNTTPPRMTAALKGFAFPILSPAARKIVAEKGVDPQQIHGTGKEGRITKQDALAFKEGPSIPRALPLAKPRKTAQASGAALTSWNEIEMSKVITLLDKYKESFQRRYGICLDLRFFFTKAFLRILQEIPDLPKDAEIISQLKASLENGGRENLGSPVFSILENEATFSTPSLEVSEVAVLGLNKIEKRVIVVDGTMKACPMMYVVFSYNAGLLDERTAGQILNHLKELIENPIGLMMDGKL